MRKLIEKLYLAQPDNLVYWDELTKVKTRFYYERVMKRQYLDKSCIVVYVDVNGLKRVNDTYGHSEGSKLLRVTAKALRELPGAKDVCRVGGDEFVLIFFNKEKADAIKSIPYISFGMYNKERHEDLSSALRKADAKMYEQKRALYAKSA